MQALRYTHLISVLLFLLIYLIKTSLLVLNKNEGLAKFTKMVKVPEMIISFLFLATGIYLITVFGVTKLLIIKIVVVLAAIPIAIVGFKKSNKALAIISLILITGAYRLGEMNKKMVEKQDIDASVSDVNVANYDIVAHGKSIYKVQCERCHGQEGENGAAGLNLSASQFDHDAKIERVKNGAGAMPAFKDALSEQEVNAVVAYVETLKK